MLGLAAFGAKLGAVSKMQRANDGTESKDSGTGQSYYSDIADAYKRFLYVSPDYIPINNNTNDVRRNAMGPEETAGSVLRYSPSWLVSIVSFGLWASPVKNEMLATIDEALASAQKAAVTLIKERKAAIEIGEDTTDVDLLGQICEWLTYFWDAVDF